MGACGGELCPAAVVEWEAANMRMHSSMMNIEYTGNAGVDFVRLMILHHQGATDMCRVLLEELMCTKADGGIDDLEGMVHLCQHIAIEQEIEVEGMRSWLKEKGLEESAACATTMAKERTMDSSCGVMEVPSSQDFIKINNKMHAYMAIDYSCNHVVDFVRMMLPHHGSAVEMCETLETFSEDDYLLDLCQNITANQRSEIALMHEWLAGRNFMASASCDPMCEPTKPVGSSCEDLLSTSSFCHGLGGQADGYCSCDRALTEDDNDLSCEGVAWVDGIGLFNPFQLCRRTCLTCDPDNGIPLYPHDCYVAHMDHNDHSDMSGSGSDFRSAWFVIALAAMALFTF